jgi:hypothetical protein
VLFALEYTISSGREHNNRENVEILERRSPNHHRTQYSKTEQNYIQNCLLGCDDVQSGRNVLTFQRNLLHTGCVSSTYSDMLCPWIRTLRLLKTEDLANRSVINKTGKMQSAPQCTVLYALFEYFCAFHITKFHHWLFRYL